MEKVKPTVNSRNFAVELLRFRNLWNLDDVQKKELTQYDFICISETWLWKDNNPFPSPSFLKNYQCFYQNATKEKSVGRSSGCIAIFCKDNLECTLIGKYSWWIAM